MKFMEDCIVRGTIENDRIVKEGEECLYKTYNRYPLAFDHARDVHLYDTAGNEYLDFCAGISVCGLGYGNEHVQEAMISQIEKGLLHTSNYFYNEPAVDAAEKLLAVSGMDRVFFTNSGTEAIEGALKIARRYHYDKKDGRTGIIAMEGSFHGRSMGALSVTGKNSYREPFEPLVGGISFATYNDLDSVKKLVNEKTGAVILETIQGEGGIYPASEEFLRGIRKLCDENDLLMMLDEVQCGMGRSGYMFAFQEFEGLKPDVLMVAKALGNGLPIGAFLARGEAASALKPGDHGSTYGGNPFVCAAASAILDVFQEEKIPEHAEEMGRVLWESLEGLKNQYPDKIVDHRGKGLIQGLEFSEDFPVGEIAEHALLDQHLVLITASHNTIRFVPPLIIERRHILDMAERFDAVMKSL